MATAESSKNMRYGISALSTEYRKYSEADELMVQTRDGLMYYKREDGQIVTAVKDYSKKDLLTDITISGLDMGAISGNYIVYHTLDITGKNDMFGDSHVSLDLEGVAFGLPNGKNSLCIRVHGNDTTDCVAAFIKAANKQDDTKKDVKLTLSVNGTDKEVEFEFNKLTYIELENSSDVNTQCTVKIKNISYDGLKALYEKLDSTKKSELIALNMDNEKFEASTIDMATIMERVNDVPISKVDGRVSLKMILPIEATVEDSTIWGQQINGQNYLNVQFLTVK